MRTLVANALLVAGGSYAASIVAKVTVVAALALVARRLARGRGAAVRHTLLAASFVFLLGLPAASIAIPPRTVLIAYDDTPAAAPPLATIPFAARSERSHAAGAAANAHRSAAAAPIAPALLAAAWALGSLAFLVPIAVGMWQARALRRAAEPWRRGEVVARRLSDAMGLRRTTAILLHRSIPGPMTCGLIRPAILLPPEVVQWHEEELRSALTHELEHVRRGDWAWQCVARLACAIYWFHPLVWMTWRRLRLDAECACDDAVVRDGDATAYANQLVLLAERLATPATRPLLAMAARRDLVTRVHAVLDTAQARGRASRTVVGLIALAAVVMIVAIAPLRAVPQGAQVANPTRDVVPLFEASVRPNNRGADEQFIRRDPRGGLTVTNMPVRALITFAYQIQPFQLQGDPDWIAAERFDIIARPEQEVAMVSPFSSQPDPMRAMLRALLADRFGLAVHTDTRELPLFELVLARRDRTLGPALHQSTTDCAALMGQAQAAARGGGPPPPLPDRARCGISISRGRLLFGGSPLSALASTLAPLTQRMVIDRTGLDGNWDFELTFSMDPAALGTPVPGAPAPAPDPNAASIFTALEEQLGLKLQPTRGPVEVLVIDRVDRPTPN